MQCLTEQFSLLPSSIGTQRHVIVHRFGARNLGPTIYLQAGLHADEAPGMVVLHHLIQLLTERNEEPRGEIVVVPCANPIALSQRIQDHHAGQYDLAMGGNFNRNYPDVSEVVLERLRAFRDRGTTLDDVAIERVFADAIAALTPKTELESLKKLLLSLAIEADYAIDLHADYEGPVYGIVSDGTHPATDLLSRQTGCVATMVIKQSGQSGSGTFLAGCYRPWRAASEYAGSGSVSRRLAVTLEYRGMTDVSDELASKDAEGLIRFMEGVGILTPSGGKVPAVETLKTTTECEDFVQANAAGVILFGKAAGDAVREGEEVAQILDPTTGERRSVFARCSGVVIGHIDSRITTPGYTIMTIAGRSPIPGGVRDPYNLG
ncbi:succinylglutamate desuccinylase/aspartoacylase family protein [Mesorhizobium sp. M0115]|uniref:succinylglutamate desuccinylase/aspartoacylase domain-containing protein n=1 Tax=Mesorhizobium sp. M0115 TaxID=2956883 RepID=UPI0033399B79